MLDSDHILISLEPRHAENILEGHKAVELRRRPMKISVGATIWIYAKLPVAAIVGRATLRAIHLNAPATLWRKFNDVTGLSRSEFFLYFDGVSRGTALELSDCQRLPSGVSLESLRKVSLGFHPPQFFVRLRNETPLLAAILSPLSP